MKLVIRHRFKHNNISAINRIKTNIWYKNIEYLFLIYIKKTITICFNEGKSPQKYNNEKRAMQAKAKMNNYQYKRRGT